MTYDWSNLSCAPAAFPAVEEMGLGSCLALAYPPLATRSVVRNTAVMLSPPSLIKLLDRFSSYTAVALRKAAVSRFSASLLEGR